jgi:hypothetical protein
MEYSFCTTIEPLERAELCLAFWVISASPYLHFVLSESGRDIQKSFERIADVAAPFPCGDRNLLGKV